MHFRLKVTASVSLLLMLTIVSLFGSTSAERRTNLVFNGDFSEDLKHWQVTKFRTLGLFPDVWCETDKTGNSYLCFDVPSGTGAYVEQKISIPPSPLVLLSFVTWGSQAVVECSVTVFRISDGESFQDMFDPEGKASFPGFVPGLKQYDITKFSGSEIILRLQARDPPEINHPPTGVMAFFDDVTISAVTEHTGVLTIALRDKKPNDRTFCLGEQVNVTGSLIPAKTTTITLDLKGPDNLVDRKNMLSDLNGHYEFRYRPRTTGIWSVRASWAGEPNVSGDVTQWLNFAVSQYPGVYLVSGMINRRQLSQNQPVAEVLLGEKITGDLRLRSIELNRFTAILVILVKLWDPTSGWVLVGQDGIFVDYFGKPAHHFGEKGVKTYPDFQRRPLYFNCTAGAYIFDLHVNLTDFNITSPSKEQVCFILIEQGAQNDPMKMLRPFYMPPPINQTFQSVREVPVEAWEKFYTSGRSENNTFMIFLVKLAVVDVNPTMEKARNKIEEVQRTGMTPTDGERLYEEALRCYREGEYSEAKRWAARSYETTEEELRKIEEAVLQKKRWIESFWFTMVWRFTAYEREHTGIENLIRAVDEACQQKSYSKFLYLESQLTDLANRYFAEYVLLNVLLLFIAVNAFQVVYERFICPKIDLAEELKKILPEKLDPHAKKIFYFSVFALAEVIQFLHQSPYSLQGEIIISSTIVLSIWLELPRRIGNVFRSRVPQITRATT